RGTSRHPRTEGAVCRLAAQWHPGDVARPTRGAGRTAARRPEPLPARALRDRPSRIASGTTRCLGGDYCGRGNGLGDALCERGLSARTAPEYTEQRHESVRDGHPTQWDEGERVFAAVLDLLPGLRVDGHSRPARREPAVDLHAEHCHYDSG